MNALIFAGGQGTRLWPASKQSNPKQLLKFIDNDTLLEHTYKRLVDQINPANIFISTLPKYKNLIHSQLPNIKEENFFLEFEKKGLGPALGLSMILLELKDQPGTFVTSWTDHYIKDQEKYHYTIKLAESFLEKHPDSIVAIGVKPTSAHTGFRYIQTMDNNLDQKVVDVKEFTDKPNSKQAEEFLTSGKYLWNTGYFISNPKHILSLYKKYLPDVHKVLLEIKEALQKDNQKLAAKLFSQLPEFNFEAFLIENPNELKAIAADFDWVDVGSWQTIKSIQSTEQENISRGLVYNLGGTGSLIYNYNINQLVTTLNIKDLIIVATEDSILIADKDSSQEIKTLISDLEKNPELGKYL
ncbi:MAG: sugar phosphate nucleotidyltransferase [Candidatus Doudnabacteria bacterium]